MRRIQGSVRTNRPLQTTEFMNKSVASRREYLADIQQIKFKKKLLGVDAVPPPLAREIAAELESKISGEVRFDRGSRALYATDASNYRQVPIGVVIPRTIDDVIETLRICRTRSVPVLNRGGGTSLAGQCCNVAVVLDYTKYLNRLLEIDPRRKRARVQPGIVLDTLRKEAGKQVLTFGPDPATHNRCTIGGMIGNNSCGAHAQMAGKTSENVHSLDILTYRGLRMKVGETRDEELRAIIRAGGPRGEIYDRLLHFRDRYANLIRERYPKIPRRISGYNLDQLLPENGFHVARALVGSESTLVTVLEAELRLVDAKPHRRIVLLGYPDIYQAGDHIPEVLRFNPIALEGLDDRLAHAMVVRGLHPEAERVLPKGKGWLMVEFGSDSPEEAIEMAHRMARAFQGRSGSPSIKICETQEEGEKFWKLREAGLAATAREPGPRDAWEGWEDAAVPPHSVGKYLRDFRALLEKYGYDCALYGHFGQGCIHVRIDFDLKSAEGVEKYRRFVHEAADLVVSYGGSLSGEHGDGQSRGELLPKMFGPELIEAFNEYKSIWDPDWKMNPGKIVHPYRVDENLRLGADYHPAQPPTEFRYPEDKGSLAYATLRCVGVGECRRHEGGTMCPSYRVTLEEKHSTRGRAHLLHEMLAGDVIRHEGWKSEAVKDALDLCIACKGCKSDCPVQVDMATYKAEFLSHYYRHHPRPITAYTMGQIRLWASLASNFPTMVNFVTQTPILRDFAKALGGIAPDRKIPAFARRTFRDWFENREPKNPDGSPVLLWIDTFNNHFHPNTARAATEALEKLGYRVLIPRSAVCCGRPLYDYGFLDQAKRTLRQTLEVLREEIRVGLPIIGLEPSCTAVFRDELTELFPNDLDAQRMKKQTLTLSEFLEKEGKPLPRLEKKAVVHGHCHHKSVMKFDADRKVLERMGLDAEVLDSGCCGMAGSFGFERENDHSIWSKRMGEKVLLPAVRKTPKDTLILADGFSCREQIRQETPRRALHLAEALWLAFGSQIANRPVNPRAKGKRMLARKKTKPFYDSSLFDAAESFNRSLNSDRRARGEPAEGLGRAAWKTARRLRQSPVQTTGYATLLVSVLATAFFGYRYIQGGTWIATEKPGDDQANAA